MVAWVSLKKTNGNKLVMNDSLEIFFLASMHKNMHREVQDAMQLAGFQVSQLKNTLRL